jgi:DNA-binding response OmpR family regulator
VTKSKKGEPLIDSIYTVLVADEDRDCRDFVCGQLADDGYQPVAACSREHALWLLCERGVHLLVVDVNGKTLSLLDTLRSGAGVAGRICSNLPIVALTAEAGELERVRFLRRGADDVVSKPFSYPELVARIDALMRRCHRSHRPGVIRVGPVTIDPAAREACVEDHELALSRIEFDLLVILASEPGRVFTKQELYRSVWGYEAFRTRTLDSHCHRLRRKLTEGGAGWPIACVWGVGYKLGDGTQEPVAA